MYTLTLRIPGIIKDKLNNYSRRKGLPKSEIARKALIEYLDKDEMRKKNSFFELSKDLAGSVESEQDLSTNKQYLTGYGK